FGFDLEAENTAKARCDRPPFGRILKRERRLRRVTQRHEQSLDQIDQQDRSDKARNAVHVASSTTGTGSVEPSLMTCFRRSTVFSRRILSWSRISPYKSASGRGGQPDT